MASIEIGDTVQLYNDRTLTFRYPSAWKFVADSVIKPSLKLYPFAEFESIVTSMLSQQSSFYGLNKIGFENTRKYDI